MAIIAIGARSLAVMLLLAVADAGDLGWPAALTVVAAVVAAGCCWLTGRPASGDLTIAAGAALLLPGWAAATTAAPALRALALTAPLVVIPLLLRALLGSGRAVTAILGVGAGIVVVRMVAFDPLIDLHCAIDCAASPVAVAATSRSMNALRVVDGLGPVVFAALGVLLALRARRRSAVTAAAAALLAAAITRAVAIGYEPTDGPALPGNRLALTVTAVATAGAMAVVALPSIRTLRARRAVAGIVRRLAEIQTGDVETRLATAVGDRTLRIAYVTEAGWIDGSGHPADPPPPTAIEVRRSGERVAAIVGAVDDRQVGTALRLALANGQLRAGVLARVADLRASRHRIVEAGDAERRLLERNLHDGAQQRLLALSFELRRAQARAPAGDLDHAVEQTTLALAELRDLAHGIFPAVLAEAGLAAALRHLADRAAVPVTVTIDVDATLPPLLEMAAYRVAVEATERSVPAAGPVTIDVTGRAPHPLVVRITGSGSGELVGHGDATDRVLACDGTLSVRSLPMGATEVVATMPCAS